MADDVYEEARTGLQGKGTCQQISDKAINEAIYYALVTADVNAPGMASVALGILARKEIEKLAQEAVNELATQHQKMSLTTTIAALALAFQLGCMSRDEKAFSDNFDQVKSLIFSAGFGYMKGAKKGR